MVQPPDPATVPGAALPPPTPTSWRPVRSRDGVLGGVCRALATATGVDVTLVRLAFVAAGLSGFGIIAYGVLWLVVPREDPALGRAPTVAPLDTARWLRAGLLIGAVIGSISLLWRFSFGWFWGPFGHGAHVGPGLFLGLFLLVGGVAAIWLRRRDDQRTATDLGRAGAVAATAVAPPTFPPPSTPPASVPTAPIPTATTAGEHPPTATTAIPPVRPPARPALRTGVVVARVFAWLAVLVAIPAAIVISLVTWVAGALSMSLPVLAGIAVIGAIVLVIVMAATSRKVWPIVLSLVVLAGSFGLAAGLARWQGGVGERTTRVSDRAAIQPSYEFAAGRFTLDLSAVDLGETTVPIAIDHHVGRLDVVLPADAALTSHVQIKGGESRVLGRVDSGRSVDQRVDDTPTGATGGVDLDVDMGFGQVVVCRAVAGVIPTNGCGNVG